MRARAQFAWLLLALIVPASALLGQTPAAAPPRPTAPQSAPAPKPAPKATPKAVVAAPAPEPANPPEVTLRDGLLTIRADNSTFSDVLNAVQRATGASIEVPASSSERVYFRGGPGQPRDVLASLLNGSSYDYILLGSAQQPQAVTRIMLTMRKSSGASPNTAAAMPPRPPSPPKPEVDTTESDNSPAPVPPQVIAPPQPAPPTPAAGIAPPPPQATPGQPILPGQVRTPEQILQELQKIQQQQQQQLQLQQQLNQQNNFSR